MAAAAAAAEAAAAAQQQDNNDDPPQTGAVVISGIEAHTHHLTCVSGLYYAEGKAGGTKINRDFPCPHDFDRWG